MFTKLQIIQWIQELIHTDPNRLTYPQKTGLTGRQLTDLHKHEIGTHDSTHEDGGADEISVDGLSGTLADDQHVLDSEVLAVAENLDDAEEKEDDIDKCKTLLKGIMNAICDEDYDWDDFDEVDVKDVTEMVEEGLNQ